MNNLLSTSGIFSFRNLNSLGKKQDERIYKVPDSYEKRYRM